MQFFQFQHKLHSDMLIKIDLGFIGVSMWCV